MSPIRRTRQQTKFDVLRRFSSDRVALISAITLAALLGASLLAPWLMRYEPTQSSDALLAGPSMSHFLGTDELGRDIASRLVYGAKSSLLVAFGAALLSAAVGVPIGLVGGYFGRWIDGVTMRIMDLLLAIPTLIVALVVVAVLGPSTTNVIIAVALPSIPTFSRLARASVLELREREFVVATRVMAARDTYILVRTILPNIMGPVIVQSVVTAAGAVVVAASLSFLGLGVPPPQPTWGSMLQEARSFLYANPWYGIFPGLALAVTILCLDRIGRGLQRALGITGGAMGSVGGGAQ